MPSQLAIGDIKVALNERRFPAITTWNRLEARPRSQNFERALRAEVRDALWMLTKQWQMGEFRGSDAGSPVFAKVLLATTRLTNTVPRAAPPNCLTRPFLSKLKSSVAPCRSTARNACLRLTCAW